MDLPSPAVRVLAQRTRAQLFSVLAELKRPAGTAELAERLRLHPNGVRLHLDLLESAGLVTRQRVQQPRGRPRDAWTIAPDTRPGGERPRAYADLGRWLTRVVAARPDHLEAVEATGREIGQELAPREGQDGQQAFVRTKVALGFQPRAEPTPAGTLVYRMGNCPYRDAVHQNQPVVCTLHRGLTRGLLDVLDSSATLTAFEPHDPDTAGCLVELTISP